MVASAARTLPAAPFGGALLTAKTKRDGAHPCAPSLFVFELPIRFLRGDLVL
jgi:hypothetical protein